MDTEKLKKLQKDSQIKNLLLEESIDRMSDLLHKKGKVDLETLDILIARNRLEKEDVLRIMRILCGDKTKVKQDKAFEKEFANKEKAIQDRFIKNRDAASELKLQLDNNVRLRNTIEKERNDLVRQIIKIGQIGQEESNGKQSPQKGKTRPQRKSKKGSK